MLLCGSLVLAPIAEDSLGCHKKDKMRSREDLMGGGSKIGFFIAVAAAAVAATAIAGGALLLAAGFIQQL